jgi:hypothetical protein
MDLWLDRARWRVGQRVARKDNQELGVIVDIDQRGVVKVKWDRGRTSYYRPEAPANVKLTEPEEQ